MSWRWRLLFVPWSLLAYSMMVPMFFAYEIGRYGWAEAWDGVVWNSREWWRWARTGDVR